MIAIQPSEAMMVPSAELVQMLVEVSHVALQLPIPVEKATATVSASGFRLAATCPRPTSRA